MDNLTHSLVGWALAETGLKNRTRKGLAACVLAANMPDIDVFFGWVPWAPLAMHRGFTHGLVGGVLLMPPLLAGLLWLLDRWQQGQGRITDDKASMNFGWLVTLCYLGALTHPLLDLQNVYAVQLMSPLNNQWFHTDGLFIVSPWLLAFLGLGIWRGRLKVRGWPAVAALSATLCFVLLNIGISQLAGKALRMSAPYPVPDRVFASPGPVLFWQREVIWRQDGAIGKAHYSPLKNVFALEHNAGALVDNMADPQVLRAIASSAEVRDFLDWSQLPFAVIERTGCKAQVTIGDARFTGPEARGGFTVRAMVPLQGPECSASVASR